MAKDRKRLTDMHVNEVSAVDRAANKRRYLVVKGEDGVAKVGEKAGAAVVKDGQGKHVAEEKKGDVLKLGKAEKEALLGRVSAALAECLTLKEALEKAEEAEGVEVPAEVFSKLASVSDGLLGKEGDVAHVAKGRKQFSAQRLTALRAAHNQLGQLLDEVGGEAEDKGAEGEGADASAELAAGMDGVTKSFESFRKDLGEFREQFGAVVAKVTDAVKATSDRVAVIEKARQVSNAVSADAGVERVKVTEKKGTSLGRWGEDLNRERQGA